MPDQKTSTKGSEAIARPRPRLAVRPERSARGTTNEEHQGGDRDDDGAR